MAQFLQLTEAGTAHDGAVIDVNMDLILTMERDHETTTLWTALLHDGWSITVQQTLEEIRAMLKTQP